MLKRLRNYFFQGLIFLAPIGITAYIFYKTFITIDGWLGLPIPGAGFVIMIVLVTIFGFLASNFLTRKILRLIDKLVARLPFVRLLHSAIKDVLTAFVGERKKFDKPVLVEVFPGASAKAVGFVTQESLDHWQLSDSVAVYFPQSFNFAGNLLIYPRAQVRPLTMESAKVMAFVLSGGVTD